MYVVYHYILEIHKSLNGHTLASGQFRSRIWQVPARPSTIMPNAQFILALGSKRNRQLIAAFTELCNALTIHSPIQIHQAQTCTNTWTNSYGGHA